MRFVTSFQENRKLFKVILLEKLRFCFPKSVLFLSFETYLKSTWGIEFSWKSFKEDQFSSEEDGRIDH